MFPGVFRRHHSLWRLVVPYHRPTDQNFFSLRARDMCKRPVEARTRLQPGRGPGEWISPFSSWHWKRTWQPHGSRSVSVWGRGRPGVWLRSLLCRHIRTVGGPAPSSGYGHLPTAVLASVFPLCAAWKDGGTARLTVLSTPPRWSAAGQSPGVALRAPLRLVVGQTKASGDRGCGSSWLTGRSSCVGVQRPRSSSSSRARLGVCFLVTRFRRRLLGILGVNGRICRPRYWQKVTARFRLTRKANDLGLGGRGDQCTTLDTRRLHVVRRVRNTPERRV